MPAHPLKVGNTIVTYEIRFSGDPFSSGKVNTFVLAEKFPEGTAEARQEKEEDESLAVVVTNQPPKGPEGTITRCSINSDTVQTEYLFPPQSLVELERSISAPERDFEVLSSLLVEKYSLEKKPTVQYADWTAVSHNVPCIDWLKKQSQLKINDLNAAKYAPEGSSFDWRPIHVRFALETIPPGLGSLTEELKRRLGSLSNFRVQVNSPDDWENNRGVVGATLVVLRPAFYIEFLRAVTQSK